MKDRLDNLKTKNIEKRKFNIAYIASNCVDKREEFYKVLLEKFNGDGVHALGKCSNNYKSLEGNHNDLDDVYQDYIFGFAMENKKLDGYLTEKILNVFRGGAIPIFWGCSESAKKFFNKGTYIDLSDFKDYNEAAQYIYELSKDKKKLKEIKSIPVFKDEKLLRDVDYYLEKMNFLNKIN